MPWKVYPEGDKYCVYKLNADGSKGSKVNGGCHATESEADDHKAALYASEKAWRKVGIIAQKLLRRLN